MLPKEKTAPKTSLSDLSILLYGQGKIGKSTWCSQAEGALFLATEPGLNSLGVYQTSITTWAEMLAACVEISNGDHVFKTIVIDTVDNAFKLCTEHICRRHNIEHESDLLFGKGYTLIHQEFSRVINKLAFLPYGLIMISHAQEKEIESRGGRKYSRIVPSLPEKIRRMIVGMVDLILFCDIEKEIIDGVSTPRRVIRTKPTALYDAGDRTGLLPGTLPLDYTEFSRALLREGGEHGKREEGRMEGA